MNDLMFVEKMKKVQHNLLDYIDNDNTEENYSNLIKILKDEQIDKNRNELELFLLLLTNIANNHFRNSLFIEKIEQIITFLLNNIKKLFTNEEIFHIFRKNKIILLYLLKNNIIKITTNLYSNMAEKKFQSSGYLKYFCIEIKEFNCSVMDTIPEDFDEQRMKGENDFEICEIIRNDKIEEFIIYVKKRDYSLNSKIESSFYESNSFLLNKKLSLIEYSAFFGSIQIFKYLYLNKANINESICIYGIHGNNPEMIDFFQENNISSKEKIYEKMLFESIKCHHNETANYILDNYIKIEEMDSENLMKYQKKLFSTCFRYHNYLFFPKNFNQDIFFFYACKYNYFYLVEYYLKNKKIDLNLTVIYIYHI